MPVGALAVEAFSVPNRCTDREPQRTNAGDADLPELAADQREEVVGVVGGAAGGGDEALVAAITIGVDRPAGDQPVGADPVRGVVHRQVDDLTGGEHDADVPLARLPGRIQLSVGQQLVAGVVAVEVADDPGDSGWPVWQSGRTIDTGPRAWDLRQVRLGGGAISSIEGPGHNVTTGRLRPNGCLE
jgi:hypothetical protein